MGHPEISLSVGMLPTFFHSSLCTTSFATLVFPQTLVQLLTSFHSDRLRSPQLRSSRRFQPQGHRRRRSLRRRLPRGHLYHRGESQVSHPLFPRTQRSELNTVHREATDAVAAGASELDVVINYPQLLAKKYAAVYTELITLRAATLPTPIKLILETSQLASSDIVAATTLAAYAGIDCVKTSTGFNGRGATVEDVRTMVGAIKAVGRSEGKERMWVKASGGVRGLESARKVLLAGAERIGTSSGVPILKEAREAVSANGIIDEGSKGADSGAGY